MIDTKAASYEGTIAPKPSDDSVKHRSMYIFCSFILLLITCIIATNFKLKFRECPNCYFHKFIAKPSPHPHPTKNPTLLNIFYPSKSRGGGGGATPTHYTPDVWALDLDMYPYWRIGLIEISAP